VDNIKMDLQEVGGVVGTEWSWLKIGTSAGTCEYSNECGEFLDELKILLASQVGLGCME
jgi:hypothetical protein